jgi:7-cyano-7-deazaguanine synthase
MAARAVVLCSGGVDSTTTMAIARSMGFEVYALTFDYGQRHRWEIEAARRVAAALGAVRHQIVNLNLTAEGGFGGSALVGQGEVPRGRTSDEMASGIPATYVPARNLIFLAFATAWAEIVGAEDVFIGVTAVDYSGYPDCRPEFIEAFERAARLATRAGVEGGAALRIQTPVIRMTKGEIIRKGLALGVDFSLTHSCYDPDERGRACGECDACRLRLRGFREAGVADAMEYTSRVHR